MTTSWCVISQTVLRNTCIDHGGLPLQAAINWSGSSLRTPAVHNIVSWPPSTSIWSYPHLIRWGLVLFLHPVLRTILRYLPWAIFSVAAIAVSGWTNWCLHCCCVSARGEVDKAPVVQLESDSIAPGWFVPGGITCCRGEVTKMITNRSGKS
jgi:hypothetical protein